MGQFVTANKAYTSICNREYGQSAIHDSCQTLFAGSGNTVMLKDGRNPPALLYAELLLNIGVLSVQADLSDLPTPETKAEISHDGRHFTLTDQGHSAALVLSAPAHKTGLLSIPASAGTQLSFRVPLAPTIGESTAFDPANPVPWSATALSWRTQVRCQQCGNVLVMADADRTWKDLPSDDWADMMDFWHCHKPSDPDTSKDSHLGTSKGYAASNKLAAQERVGLVGLTYFLFSKRDCSRIVVGSFPL